MTEYQTFFKKLMETYITKGNFGEGRWRTWQADSKIYMKMQRARKLSHS